jgi:hypothetical protein
MPSSSVVERSAVNRLVVGSSPTLAVKDIVSLEFDFLKDVQPVNKKHFCFKHNKEKSLIQEKNRKPYHRCLDCKVEKDSQNRRDSKAKLAEAHGGCCKICGYNKTPWAMEFHHRNPEEKEFSIGSSIVRCLRKLFEESKKCVLLCANCHREYHAGLFDISEIPMYEITTPLELLDKNPELFDMEILKSLPIREPAVPVFVPIAQLDRATAF